MPEVVSNTSPLLYLHRIGVLDWLPELFSEIRVPGAVVHELNEGRLRGYNSMFKFFERLWLSDFESVCSAGLQPCQAL